MEGRTNIANFLGEALEDAASGFSIGVSGAIAEFMRSDGRIDVRRDGDTITASTRGGAMRIELKPGVEIVTRHGKKQVALCLERQAAAMGGRRALTELGADAGAVDLPARNDIRFDLGLGIPHVDACVRSRDPDLVALLRRYCGRGLLSGAREACEAIVALSPERVFCSRIGRIEVSTPIPKDKSPAGPHTHLLPHLLGRPGPMDALLPPGHVSCLDVYLAQRVDTFQLPAID